MSKHVEEGTTLCIHSVVVAPSLRCVHLEHATDCAAYPVAVGVALNPIVRLQAPGRGHVDGEDVFAASPRERAAG